MDSNLLLTLLIGFTSGLLSGTFGIGGGILSTPAIRLLLGFPAGIAVGTPLLLSIPSALIGVYNYNKNKLIAWELIAPISILGIVGVLIGAGLTAFIDARYVLLVTAAIIFVVSIKFLRPGTGDISEKLPRGRFGPYSIGFLAGLYSGFLGLGGGIVMVPLINIWLRKDIKTAFGTSLVLIIILSIPGSVVHYFLDHIDLMLALVLSIGAVPGAYIGSYIVPRIKTSKLELAFGLLLVSVAVYMAIFELVGLTL